MDLTKVRIFFVISNKFEDEKETSDFMQEAYALTAADHSSVNWIREQDQNDYEFIKTDFIVFEEFTGKFFKEVCKTRSARIIGPICMITCLSEGKSIPNVDWPLLNLSLEDCTVSCSGLSKEQKKIYGEKIQFMGGYYVTSLTDSTTHLLTDTVRSEKYTKAASSGIKIVLPSWIESIWDASQNASIRWDDEKFNGHTCKPFHKLTICSTGLNPAYKKRITQLVESNGGIFVTALNPKSTDVLVCESASGPKYTAARKNKVSCVSIDWILDSEEKGYAISVSDYTMKKCSSTPVKENVVLDPNFSIISAINGSTFNANSILQETVNFTQPFPNKLNSTPRSVELVDSLDIKQAKRAGSFLDGCSIYLVGFSSQHHEKLCKILNFSGSTRYDSFSERITHVVVGDPTCHELKILATKDLQCAIVSVDWVLHSMENKKPISEEKYLITTTVSPSAASKSPLIKKGLRLLKANVSVLDEPAKVKSPEQPLVGIDDELRKQYLNPFGTGTEDTLAAFLEKNNFDTVEHAGAVSKAITLTDSSTSENITITENTIFNHLNFMVLNFESEEEEELVRQIKDFGGIIVPKSYKGVTDYIVVPIHLTELRHTANEIVTNVWISECVTKKCVVEPIEYYHRPCNVKSKTVLQGTVISISGYEHSEKKFLKDICISMGSCVQDSMARITKADMNLFATTHLISFEDSGKKYQAAIKWGLHVVNKDWVLANTSSNKKVDESNYLFIGSSKESSTLNPCLPEYTSVSKSSRSLNITVNKSTQQIRNEEEKALENMFKIAEGTYSNTPTTSHQIEQGSPTTSHQIEQGSPTTSRQIERDTPTTSCRIEQGTPTTNRLIDQATSVCTPRNQIGISPIASQITPVDKVLRNANFNLCHLGEQRSQTPSPKRRREDSISTPESPYGAFICNPPGRTLRKDFARWINGFPDVPLFSQRQKCLSTPISELKRRLWKKVCPNYSPSTSRKPKQPDFNETECEEEVEELIDEPIQDLIDNISSQLDDDTPENELINQKLKEFQNIVSSSGGQRRRSSIKPTFVHSNLEVESQPYPIGWNENLETKPEVTPSPVKNTSISKLFMISGIMEEKKLELTEKIEELGGEVSDVGHFEPKSTHLIVEKLSRNEKILCSMAAGKWILHPSYITDSMAAGKFLNCEDYEFANPKNKFHIDKDYQERATKIYYWRKKIAECGYGPFHNIRAVILSKKKDALQRLTEAGGGMVLDVQPPFNENIYATHCFVDGPYLYNVDENIIGLAKKGTYCVNSIYLSNFLHGREDVSDQILPSLIKYH